jgi:hypothetical protein
MQPPAICISRLMVRYGPTIALDDADLEVAAHCGDVGGRCNFRVGHYGRSARSPGRKWRV